MNVKKRCKKIHYLTERPFKKKNLYKIAALSKKDHKLYWSSVKALLRDTNSNKSNSIHPNTWKTYFKTLLNNNSGENQQMSLKAGCLGWKMIKEVRLDHWIRVF